MAKEKAEVKIEKKDGPVMVANRKIVGHEFAYKAGDVVARKHLKNIFAGWVEEKPAEVAKEKK